ncbi:hypothetical protein [Ornatilinea apprima]|nr:hypothetical protein [Ornatilinea apprima]
MGWDGKLFVITTFFVQRQQLRRRNHIDNAFNNALCAPQAEMIDNVE